MIHIPPTLGLAKESDGRACGQTGRRTTLHGQTVAKDRIEQDFFRERMRASVHTEVNDLVGKHERYYSSSAYDAVIS